MQAIQILKFHKLTNYAHIKLLIILLVTVLFIPLFFSKLSLIDDHEIISFLNSYKINGIYGILNEFSSLGDFNGLVRFRPIYYFIRLIEIFAWKDNAFLWAFFRYLIAVSCSLYIFVLAKKKYTKEFSLSLSLLLCCLPSIPDIFFRFGPSEIYAIVFIVLLIGSLIQNRSSESNLLKASIYITLLIGIKENFVILFLIQIYALFRTIKTKNVYYSFISLFLSSISLICIYIIFRKIYFNSGYDVYNATIGFSRIDLILTSFLKISGIKFLSLSFLIIFYLSTLWSNNKQALELKHYLFGAIFSSLILFNIYFYSGIPYLGSRYGLPLWPLIIFLFYILTKQYLSYRVNERKWVPNASALGWIIFLIFTVCFSRNLTQALKVYETTNQTFRSVKKAIDLSKQYKVVVVHANGESNYEQSFSIVKFLNFYAGTKMVYLILDTDSKKVDAPNNTLLNEMQNISFNGGRGYIGLKNTTLSHSECINIFFGIQNTPSPCHNGENIIIR